jgi:hypothetical protein
MLAFASTKINFPSQQNITMAQQQSSNPFHSDGAITSGADDMLGTMMKALWPPFMESGDQGKAQSKT